MIPRAAFPVKFRCAPDLPGVPSFVMTYAGLLSAAASGLALTFFVSAGPVPQKTPETGSDWPGFRGPARDGKSDETSILLNWSEKGPPVKWSRAVGEGFSMRPSAPTVHSTSGVGIGWSAST